MSPIVILGSAALVAIFVLALATIARERRRRVADAAQQKEERVSGVPDAFNDKCQFCASRATHQMPAIKHARPFADVLLRRLGVVPVVTYRLELYRGVEAPFELCELHFYRARSLLEVEIGEVPSSYAKWLDGKTKELIEFQSRGLAERMAADEAAVSKRKRGSKAPAAGAAVVTLTQKKEVAS